MGSGNLAERALVRSERVAVLIVGAGWVGEGTRTTLGIAFGAAVGLFSVSSLIFVVPGPALRGGRIGAPAGPVVVFKLLLIAAVLWFAMTSPYVRPFAVFVGAAVVPVVVVGMRLKCALALSGSTRRERFRFRARRRTKQRSVTS